MHAPIATASLRRIRHHLRSALKAKRVGAGHIAEALATAAGFKSALAMKEWCRNAQPYARLALNAEAFISRLVSLGYDHDHGDVHQALEDACTAETLTVDGMRAAFADIINECASNQATDVHFSVSPRRAELRVRINGEMLHVRAIPPNLCYGICSAAFGITDKSQAGQFYRPDSFQDGRILSWGGLQSIKVHFSPLHNGGRHMICRLIRNPKTLDISKGLPPNAVRDITVMREAPYGMNIICGPTGSGKSTMLNYLSHLDGRQPLEFSPPTQWTTISEDSLEEDKKRYDVFLSSIQASLRDDPEVLLAGEINNEKSARLAFAGAMTGHVVWAEMYANNSFHAFNRLLDSGMEPYKVFDETLVRGIISQRSIPYLCDDCSITLSEAVFKETEDIEFMSELDKLDMDLSKVRVRRRSGCKACNNYGLSGRTIVCETLVPDMKFMNLMRNGEREAASAWWLDPNGLDGITMLEHGIARMLRGEVDPHHVSDKLGPLEMQPGRHDVVRELCHQLGKLGMQASP